VILVHGIRAVAAVQQEMLGTPIVFASVPDPVSSGIGASLAHPGGDITGFTAFGGSNTGKLAGLLKEMAPGITRAALLLAADFVGNAVIANAIETAAEALAAKAIIVPIRDPSEISRAFEGPRPHLGRASPRPMLLFGRSNYSRSTVTGASPDMPSACAAAGVTSMMRPCTNGPRSLIVTTTERPLL
jgi:hypothetical protein